ncbi:hypothetical protein AUP42_12945 [Thalassospira lucentensis]|uniref:Uncharacterized protein n=1 Tax=Thalassospira lucentensis TaxID=168935 RepID=A0A154L950_9PROT|nr:hypothetical protein AUP42_12945 [Thalassospira lucentensis]
MSRGIAQTTHNIENVIDFPTSIKSPALHKIFHIFHRLTRNPWQKSVRETKNSTKAQSCLHKMETYLQTIIIKGSRVPATDLKTRERSCQWEGIRFGQNGGS